ncbi:hypothetical protein Leryth_018815 [Lithospermum erythrorhizon]|nr:hypothetical protein Leryth_018815 [Lithospermum erythrorhizon]
MVFVRSSVSHDLDDDNDRGKHQSLFTGDATGDEETVFSQAKLGRLLFPNSARRMTENTEVQFTSLATKEDDRKADNNFNIKWSADHQRTMGQNPAADWRILISNPRFAEIYFKQTNPSLLIRIFSGSCVPRTCYLLESTKNFWIRDVTLKLDAKLKIPLRDLTAACNLDKLVNSRRESKRKRCLKLRLTDQKFRIANSCNGFLCLSELRYCDPVLVCNPVTGDYINLPACRKTYGESDCGIGFSPDSNQFKSVFGRFRRLSYAASGWVRVGFLSMGVLRGCLCLSDASRDAPLKLWLMEKYGAKESWMVAYSIDVRNPYSQTPPYYQPITYLGCGVLLMCHYPGYNLLCYNPQTREVKFLKLSGLKAKCEAVFYIPNLMLMRDVIGGSDAQIWNVNSAGGEIKIQGESKDHSLIEEDSEAFKSRTSPRGRLMRWRLIP